MSDDDLRGLSHAEVTQRRALHGPNEWSGRDRRGWRSSLKEVLREPMFVLLLCGAVIYLAIGEVADGILLLVCVLAVIGLTLFQAQRTEHALEALSRLAEPWARVIRDGVRERIPARELTVGDWIELGEGERVPADALLRRTTHLSVDESLLTGESMTVMKRPSVRLSTLATPGRGPSAESSLFAGTLVTAGQGVAEVVKIGAATELSRMGLALRAIDTERTPLQLETTRVVRKMALAGLLACLLVVVVYGFTRGGDLEAWKQGMLAGIAMAMSVLPEEFAVVLTIFLALGAWRMSQRQVLTRRFPAIEALGSATVLCVDKTGTLTENRMALATLSPVGCGAVEPAMLERLKPEHERLLYLAAQAANRDSFDPMDRALRAEYRRLTGLELNAKLRREYPLTAAQPVVGCVWSKDDDAFWTLAVKGAPEAVAELCALDQAQRDQLDQEMSELAGSGLRVLAVATAQGQHDLPESLRAFSLTWLGLVAFADPLRASVPAAVEECHAAGIRVIMITGDYPLTARSIAKEAGIPFEQVRTGEQLASWDETSLQREIATTQVFARVAPREKLRLVEALKRAGEVVAMTGDGVNDAPALKAAHIGIAMGERGTQVAREAASLILLDDAFESIVAAVRQGRRIYANIIKASRFIFAVHVPIAGLSMLPVLMGDWPLILLPVHIAFLEFIIDPACALVFEEEKSERDDMRHPPRPVNERLFSRHTVVLGVLQGLSLGSACAVIFALSWPLMGAEQARALAFVALVVGVLIMILINRSETYSAWSKLREKNLALLGVGAFSVAFLILAVSVEPIQSLFSFADVSVSQVMIAALVAMCSLMWFELFKVWRAAHAPKT